MDEKRGKVAQNAGKSHKRDSAYHISSCAHSHTHTRLVKRESELNKTYTNTHTHIHTNGTHQKQLTTKHTQKPQAINHKPHIKTNHKP
jgi:hypothetical protein